MLVAVGDGVEASGLVLQANGFRAERLKQMPRAVQHPQLLPHPGQLLVPARPSVYLQYTFYIPYMCSVALKKKNDF
eukprot:8787815-Pyramimonas_sp.AAC.1